MYKYKSKSHCETSTTDEELESIQNSLFPSFENDFEDDSALPDVVVEATDQSRKLGHTADIPVIDEAVIFNIVRNIYLDSHPMSWSLDEVLSQSFKMLSRLMSVSDMLQGNLELL